MDLTKFEIDVIGPPAFLAGVKYWVKMNNLLGSKSRKVLYGFTLNWINH